VKTDAFRSTFAPHVEGLIAHKRAIGYRYQTQAAILSRFDRFCVSHHGNEQTVSKEIVFHWAERRPGESVGAVRIRVSVVRQLALYLQTLGHEAYVIPPRTLPRYLQYVPYIFTERELQLFFSQTDSCRYWGGSPLRHLVMPVLFRLFYCCGLRVSEASNLKLRDVDLDHGVLTVRGGKFGRDRQVPMSDEITNRLRDYCKRVPAVLGEDRYLLGSSLLERPLPVRTVYFNFRRFLWEAGISHGGAGKGPRVHDFRHTFAVHCLRRWVQEGKDLSAYLPLLTAYLGHSHFRQTAYYLRLTADLYPAITARVEQIFGQIIPQLEVVHENH